MKKHRLRAENLKVQSFQAIAEPTESKDPGQPDGCICFAPPCICSAGPDCTQA